MAVINPAAYGSTSVPSINPAAYTGTAFGQPTYNQYQQAQDPNGNTIKFVRGINEAATYPADKPVLLLDATEPVFYIKDHSSLRVFDYTERNQNANNGTEYVTKKEFDELKKLIDELTK
jgi:hypothetical protein